MYLINIQDSNNRVLALQNLIYIQHKNFTNNLSDFIVLKKLKRKFMIVQSLAIVSPMVTGKQDICNKVHVRMHRAYVMKTKCGVHLSIEVSIMIHEIITFLV